MMRTATTLCLLAGSLLLIGCSGTAPAPATEGFAPLGLNRAALPDTVVDFDGFRGRLYREGRVLISGQPTEEALRQLPGRGVTAVVNLRTPQEMDDRERVAFDEAVVLAEAGVEYIHLPSGGAEHPYSPATVDAFHAALTRHEGGVLLHCTVGWRASHLWAAYLVKYQGFSLAEAYARGTAIGISPAPIESFLDRGMTLKYTD
jgi:uncharacterized protein (TIGR01244 family)